MSESIFDRYAGKPAPLTGEPVYDVDNVAPDPLTEEERYGPTPTVAPAGLAGDFKRGFKSGLSQLDSDTDYFQALVQRSLGFEDAAADNIRRARITEEINSTALDGMAQFDDLVENPTLRDFLQYSARVTGQVTPFLATTLAGGVSGAAAQTVAKLGLGASARAAGKRAIEDSIKRTAAGTATLDERELAELAYDYGRNTWMAKTARNLKGGATAGMLAEEYKTMAGANYGENLRIDGLDDTEARLRAAGIAIPQAIIGVTGERFVLSMFKDKLAKVAAQRAAGKNGAQVFGGLVADIGKGAARSAPIEMTTEFLQDSMQVASRLQTDPTYTKEQANLRLAESAAAGFIAGAGMGGAGGTASGSLRATKDLFAGADEYINKVRQAKFEREANAKLYGSADGYTTTPESPQTVAAQMRAMLDPNTNKTAVWVAGDPIKAMEGVDSGVTSTLDIDGETVFAQHVEGRGTIVSKNKNLVEEVGLSKASDQALATALGYSDSKRPNDNSVIQVKDADGKVIWEQATNENLIEEARAAANSIIGKAEGYTVERTTVEQALEERASQVDRETGPTIRNIDQEGILEDLLSQMSQNVDEESSIDPDQITAAEVDQEIRLLDDRAKPLVERARKLKNAKTAAAKTELKKVQGELAILLQDKRELKKLRDTIEFDAQQSLSDVELEQEFTLTETSDRNTRVVEDNKGKGYEPRVDEQVFETTQAARDRWQKAMQLTDRTIDFTKGVAATLSDAVLNKAAELQEKNPETIISINTVQSPTAAAIKKAELEGTKLPSIKEGHFVIEQTTLPDQVTGTPLVPGTDSNISDQGLANTLSKALRDGIKKAKDSFFANFYRTKNGGKKPIPTNKKVMLLDPETGKQAAVNLVDLVNTGRRLLQADLRQQFTEGGVTTSQREGFFRIMSELISREYKIKIGGQLLTKRDAMALSNLDRLTEFEKEFAAYSRKKAKASREGTKPPVMKEELRSYLTNMNVIVGFDDASNPIKLGELLGVKAINAPFANKTYTLEVQNFNPLNSKGELKPLARFNQSTLALLSLQLGLDFRTDDGVIYSKKDLYKAIKDAGTYYDRAATDKISLEGNKQEIMELLDNTDNKTQPTTFNILDSSGRIIMEGVQPDVIMDRDNINNPFIYDEADVGLDERTAPLDGLADMGSETEQMAANQPEKVETLGPSQGANAALNTTTYTGPKILSDFATLGGTIPQMAAKVAIKALNLKYAVSTLSVDSLIEASPETMSKYFSDPAVAKAVLQQAKDMKKNKKAARYLGFENAHFVIVDTSIENEVQTAYAVGHELGHALFREQMDNSLDNPVLKKRLYNAFLKAQKAEGAPKSYKKENGFEEWYSDQVSIWANKTFRKVLADNIKTERQSRDRTGRALERRSKVDPLFKDEPSSPALQKLAKELAAKEKAIVITKGVAGTHFKGIAKLLKKHYDSLSAALKQRFGPDAYSETFAEYMNNVLEQNKGQNAVPSKPAGQAAVVREIPRYKDKVLADAIAEATQKEQDVNIATFFPMMAKKVIESKTFEGVYNLIVTADSRLRKVAGDKMADMFYIRSQDSNRKMPNPLGMLKAATTENNKWINGLEDRLGGKLDDPSLDRAFDEAFDDSVDTADLRNPQAKIIRKYFEEFHDQYIAPSNSNIAKRENYVPRVLKLDEIHERAEAFIDLILESEPDADRAKVKSAVETLVGYHQSVIDGESVKIGKLDPAKSAEKALQLTRSVDLKKLKDAGFVEDPRVSSIKYIAETVKRVEWNRHTKDSAGYNVFEEEYNKLSSPKQKEVDLIVQKYIGYNIKPIGPVWRNIQSALTLVQVVAILPLAVIGSLPELAGPMVASKEFNSMALGMREIVNTIKNKEEARQFARDVGLITSQTAAEVLMSQAELEWMTQGTRQMTDSFFRFIQLDNFTKFTRAYALNMGVKFLQKHASPVESNANSFRYLQELGVSAADVNVWIKSDQDFTTPEGKAVELALRKFTETATLRPNAAERPVWASDPHYALLWQLKGFFYSYGKVMLAGVKREAMTRATDANAAGAGGLATAGAAASIFALLGIATLPLAMVGMETREYVKYGLAWAMPGIDPEEKNYFRTDDMSWGAYIKAAMERSFAAGPASIGYQMMQAADWGRGVPGAVSVGLGPTAETVERMFTDGVDSTIRNRVLPTGLL